MGTDVALAPLLVRCEALLVIAASLAAQLSPGTEIPLQLRGGREFARSLVRGHLSAHLFRVLPPVSLLVSYPMRWDAALLLGWSERA
jgi:hypothetical protein